MLVPQFAFQLLKEAQEEYQDSGKFPDETLQALHCIFGSPFAQAVEFLDTAVVLQYETPNTSRRLLKVSDRYELYTLFSDVNFCYCPVFKEQVLKERSLVTCKHVLSAKLAEIQGTIKIESVTNSQLADLKNDTIQYIKN